MAASKIGKKKPEQMASNKNGYGEYLVAYFDILGFKNMIIRFFIISFLNFFINF